MTIKLSLSEESIQNAIRKLEDAKDNLDYGVQQTVEMLTKEGALTAQSSYGGMASVDYDTDETMGIIGTSGKANIIAEFGAGDATEVPTMFENMPNTPVYPGSYSESDEGAGMYVQFGWWKFGGKIYRKIEPRHGLLHAKNYIVENAADIAKEVIVL